MATRYKNKVVNDLEKLFLDYLEEEAQYFFDEILDRVGKGGSSYFNRSMNLYDSFGYGIYLNGNLLRSSARKRQQQATEPGKKWYGDRFFGHELMVKAFSSSGYKPSVGKGYVVVFAATMPYTNVLQYGREHGLSKDYHVIAFMQGELQNFGKKHFRMSLVEQVRDGNYQAWKML